MPYGDPAQAAFPAFVAGINADPDVAMVTHLGDIKSGSTTCDDQRFATVRHDFDGFADPLVYTPGDNEWTDCHRANNGGYHPLERLAAVRSLFFSAPRQTSGEPVPVDLAGRPRHPRERPLRSAPGCPSRPCTWSAATTTSALDRARQTAATPEQSPRSAHRMAAAIDNLHAAFRDARRAPPARRGRSSSRPTCSTRPCRTRRTPTTRRSGRWCRPWSRSPAGSTARCTSSTATATGSTRTVRWRPARRGSRSTACSGSAANLHRVTVDGSDLGEADWLKVTVQPRGRDLLTFQQVPGSLSSAPDAGRGLRAAR